MYILGISSFYHDSAACLIKDNEIIAAAQEERFTRIKNDSSFPKNSIKYCVKEAKIEPNEILNVVFYEKPFLKFERLLETYLAFAPKGFKSFLNSMPLWLKDKLFQKNIIINELQNLFGSSIDWREKLLFSQHHLSHAASAFYPSPFDRAAILSIDGVGEWSTTTLSIGCGNEIKILQEIKFPHSLGLLYSAFTYHIGFKVNSGEYKLMGLAPYGETIYIDKIKDNLIKIADDGSFQINIDYFDFATGLKMTNEKFDRLFECKRRAPETNIEKKHMDMAASIQKVTEEIMLKLLRNISQKTKEKNLCMAGGVALNCVVNGMIHKEKLFENIWIQPASGDSGAALGAALSVFYLNYLKKRKTLSNTDSMKGSLLGPNFNNDDIKSELDFLKAKYFFLKKEDLIDFVVKEIISQKAIGWMQGKMEFGPRALGNRSIIADPRSPTMQKKLNLKIKKRESFRPFAPSILLEDAKEWFEFNFESPYMMFVADLDQSKKIDRNFEENNISGFEKLNSNNSLIPSVTHVDFSSRLQTVDKKTNKLFYELLSKFKKETGFPILINTSFNMRGEPIVCSPTDAFKCFINTDLDILVIGNYILKKEDQDQKLKHELFEKYELD